MSSPLTELLDGGTILMDACKIQGLNSYFAKFKDEFGRCVKIQGRNWGINLKSFYSSTYALFFWHLNLCTCCFFRLLMHMLNFSHLVICIFNIPLQESLYETNGTINWSSCCTSYLCSSIISIYFSIFIIANIFSWGGIGTVVFTLCVRSISCAQLKILAPHINNIFNGSYSNVPD